MAAGWEDEKKRMVDQMVQMQEQLRAAGEM
jgi:hypothetical protein